MNPSDYQSVEGDEASLQPIQYQIASNSLHPSMVSTDGTTYAYTQAQINQVNSQVRLDFYTLEVKNLLKVKKSHFKVIRS